MTAKIKSLSSRGSRSYQHKPRGISDRAFAKVYWPYLPMVLVVGALLTFSAQAGALQAAVNKHTTRVLDYATSMQISALLADSNSARAANGVGALSINGQLNAAAQAQANDMAARNYWSHNTPEGQPPWIWVTAQGYNYQKLGQNLAAGFSGEQATVDGWMNSPPHRENLLDPDYVDVGFGSANNPNYTSAGGGPMTIVVAFYGEPAGGSPAPVAPASTTPSSSTPAASQSSTPASSETPTPTSEQTNPTPVAATPAPVASQSDAQPTKTEPQPVTTESNNSGVTLSYRTSNAQLAFAHLPNSTLATSFVLIAGVAAVGLWVSRHLFAFRRVLIYGESFVVHHPLIDVGLLTIGALSLTLSQTAGFIK